MGCAGGLGDPGSRVSLRDGSHVVVRGLVGAFHYLSIYLFIAICRGMGRRRLGDSTITVEPMCARREMVPFSVCIEDIPDIYGGS